MKMTKEEFKRRWDSDENGGGLTFEDIADCAEAWGLVGTARIRPIHDVRVMVLEAAGIDATDYKFEEEG